MLNNVNMHQVVVHRLYFVYPVTGVHTQEIESCWNNLKFSQKMGRGERRDDIQAYLDEQMWRQWRVGPLNMLCRIFGPFSQTVFSE